MKKFFKNEKILQKLKNSSKIKKFFKNQKIREKF